jgi:hypothetical protein
LEPHPFEHLPQATPVEDLEALLPWNAEALLQPRTLQQHQDSLQPAAV